MASRPTFLPTASPLHPSSWAPCETMEHEKSPLKGPDDPDFEILEELLPRRLFQDNIAMRMRSRLPPGSQSPDPTLVLGQSIKQPTSSAITPSEPAMGANSGGLPPKPPPAGCGSATFTGAVITASPRINAIRDALNTTPISPRFTSPPSIRLSRKKEKARGPFAAMEQKNGDKDEDGDSSMMEGN